MVLCADWLATDGLLGATNLKCDSFTDLWVSVCIFPGTGFSDSQELHTERLQ